MSLESLQTGVSRLRGAIAPPPVETTAKKKINATELGMPLPGTAQKTDGVAGGTMATNVSEARRVNDTHVNTWKRSGSMTGPVRIAKVVNAGPGNVLSPTPQTTGKADAAQLKRDLIVAKKARTSEKFICEVNKNHLENAQDELKALEAQKSQPGTDQTALKSQIRDKKDEISELKSKIKQSETSIAQLEDKIRALTKETQAPTSTPKLSEADRTSLQINNTALEKQRNKLQNRVNLMKGTLLENAKELKNLEAELKKPVENRVPPKSDAEIKEDMQVYLEDAENIPKLLDKAQNELSGCEAKIAANTKKLGGPPSPPKPPPMPSLKSAVKTVVDIVKPDSYVSLTKQRAALTFDFKRTTAQLDDALDHLKDAINVGNKDDIASAQKKVDDLKAAKDGIASDLKSIDAKLTKSIEEETNTAVSEVDKLTAEVNNGIKELESARAANDPEKIKAAEEKLKAAQDKLAKAQNKVINLEAAKVQQEQRASAPEATIEAKMAAIKDAVQAKSAALAQATPQAPFSTAAGQQVAQEAPSTKPTEGSVEETGAETETEEAKKAEEGAVAKAEEVKQEVLSEEVLAAATAPDTLATGGQAFQTVSADTTGMASTPAGSSTEAFTTGTTAEEAAMASTATSGAERASITQAQGLQATTTVSADTPQHTAEALKTSLPPEFEARYVAVDSKAQDLGKSISQYNAKRQDAVNTLQEFQTEFKNTAEKLAAIPHPDVKAALEQGNPALVREENIPIFDQALSTISHLHELKKANDSKQFIVEQSRQEVLQKSRAVESDWKSFENDQNEIKGLYPGNVLKKPPEPLKDADRIAREPAPMWVAATATKPGVATPQQLQEAQRRGGEATVAQNLAENYQRPAAPLSGVVRGREEAKRETEKAQAGNKSGEGGSEGGSDSGKQGRGQQSGQQQPGGGGGGGGAGGAAGGSAAGPTLGGHRVTAVRTS